MLSSDSYAAFVVGFAIMTVRYELIHSKLAVLIL